VIIDKYFLTIKFALKDTKYSAIIFLMNYISLKIWKWFIIKYIPKNVRNIICDLNAMRNAFAHSLQPQDRRVHKTLRKVFYRGKGLRTYEGLKMFMEDTSRAHMCLCRRSFHMKLSPSQTSVKSNRRQRKSMMTRQSEKLEPSLFGGGRAPRRIGARSHGQSGGAIGSLPPRDRESADNGKSG
jgi:hypothetical protein